ncbi:hypothetical protein X777_00243 [Ooceraea biroi]|uniref:Uncharacterized protein n=1 Tax=Ooceraea biroi TaxID=2015173 RepID=A0A026VRV1_OOCBI|nr:hypothetical protein X777_00243 [Ooceraea biroi]
MQRPEGLNVSKIYIVRYLLDADIAGVAGKCNTFVISRIIVM